MGKHKKHTKACTASAHVKKRRVTVKATCPLKGKVSIVHSKVKHHHATNVPPACKGLKKKARKACVRKVCAQRPSEYRDQCLKAGGVRS